MITHDVDVLIAGMGPVGSTAALYLAQQGINVAAIDAGPADASDLRASTFHAPTIEILHKMGAADLLLNDGLKAPIYQYRDRSANRIYSFDLTELSDMTDFPYRIQCEQHRVARSIVSKLRDEHGMQAQYRNRLLYCEQSDDSVIAYVETDQAIERYRAKYLVGADGASSVTRKLLGLGFPGYTHDEKFLCYSTDYPIESAFDNLSHVNYISDPDEWMVLLKVPGLWRVLVPADQGESDAALLSDEKKNDVFARMLNSDVDVKTHHRTIYRVHQRVCERFAEGRVCLIGDSAHLNSPMGGFGMNSGIHDAINLCEKLTRILRQNGDPALIDLYDRQRRKVTQDFIQVQSIENTKLMSQGWDNARVARGEQMERLSNDPVARRNFLLKQAMFTSLDDAAAIL